MSTEHPLKGKTALITGAAARVGATIARHLHDAGAHVIIHYRNSLAPAENLQQELLEKHPDSASLVQGDLLDIEALPQLVQQAIAINGKLDILVNNASVYYPTPIGTVTEAQWHELMGINAKVPFFLAQACADALRESKGSIINLVDIHAERPNKNHPVYSAAKAANALLVKSLARELAPDIRVNAVAPGAILWPETDDADEIRADTLPRIPLGRPGTPDDIGHTVVFLATSNYVNGQIIAVDGGRSTQQ